MFVLTCPDCGHKEKVRHACLGASSMCTLCSIKFKLTRQTMKPDVLHHVQQKRPRKMPVEHPIFEKNSETNILRARIEEFDKKSRQGEEKIVLEPVGSDVSEKPLPMLKSSRRRGLFGFMQSMFNVL